MSVAAFISHIADRSPAFKCYACGDREASLALVAHLTHDIGAPGSSSAVDEVRNWLGSHADVFVDICETQWVHLIPRHQERRGWCPAIPD